MRVLTVALVAVMGAAALAAIETEYVPLDQIKGEAWDFQFEFRLPQRVTVVDKKGNEHAYWCLLYTVTNPDKVAHDFVPQAVLFTDSGKLAADGLYPAVVETVKRRYRLKELKNSVQMMGPLKAGQDEAQDGVFVFPEVDPRMDAFKVFVTGLSGQFTVRTIPAAKEGQEPKEIVLRKTMELDFSFPGDEIDLDEDKVYLAKQKWIWR